MVCLTADLQGWVTGPVSSWVLYAVHGVLGEYHTWQYKSQDDKWHMAAQALWVLHAAILAGARFPGPSGPPGAGGLPALAAEQGRVQITHLAATLLQQMCCHGGCSGYCGHLHSADSCCANVTLH